MARQHALPYCTVKGFKTCLEILGRTPPRIVDRHSLVERGLSKHAAYPVLGALRYLGLIDEFGRLTTDAALFLEGGLEGRHRVVTRAYADLLSSIPFPVEDREDVDRLLVRDHGAAIGVAAFCSTFFLWLAAEAGLPVATIRRTRRGRPPAHLSQLSEEARAAQAAQAKGAGLDSGVFERPGTRVEPAPEAPPRESPRHTGTESG